LPDPKSGVDDALLVSRAGQVPAGYSALGLAANGQRQAFFRLIALPAWLWRAGIAYLILVGKKVK